MSFRKSRFRELKRRNDHAKIGSKLNRGEITKISRLSFLSKYSIEVDSLVVFKQGGEILEKCFEKNIKFLFIFVDFLEFIQTLNWEIKVTW